MLVAISPTWNTFALCTAQLTVFDTPIHQSCLGAPTLAFLCTVHCTIQHIKSKFSSTCSTVSTWFTFSLKWHACIVKTLCIDQPFSIWSYVRMNDSVVLGKFTWFGSCRLKKGRCQNKSKDQHKSYQNPLHFGSQLSSLLRVEIIFLWKLKNFKHK